MKKGKKRDEKSRRQTEKNATTHSNETRKRLTDCSICMSVNAVDTVSSLNVVCSHTVCENVCVRKSVRPIENNGVQNFPSVQYFLLFPLYLASIAFLCHSFSELMVLFAHNQCYSFVYVTFFPQK